MGKSVLLRTLANLYPAAYEEFLLGSVKLEDISPEEFRSRVLYVGSSTHGTGEITTEEFLAAPLRLKVYQGFSPSFPVLEWVNRWNLSGKKLSHLSSGQKQLLIFLRAISLKSELLLLDEFTSHLDREKTQDVERLLEEWRGDGRSYLVVSHSQDQAQRLGERIDFGSLVRA